MSLLSTVVVVHDNAAPDVHELFALCREHLELLAGVPWASVDEVIGISNLLSCQACVLVEQESRDVPIPVLAAR